MKIKWIILSFVFGGLFFALGCALDASIIEFFGAFVMFPGILGISDKLFPEKSAK